MLHVGAGHRNNCHIILKSANDMKIFIVLSESP